MKKLLNAGVASAVAMITVNFAMNPVCNLLFPSLHAEYCNAALFRPWSDPRMMLFLLSPFLYAFPYAWIYPRIKDKLPSNIWKAALVLTAILFFINSLPGMFISYTSFPLSLLMITSWLLSGIIQTYVGILVICRLNK